MAITTVIFDFGGVFTTSPFEAFRRYEEASGLPKDFLRSVNATNPDTNAWAQLERDAIDAEGFDAMFRTESAALGHEVPGSDVLELLSGELRPRVVEALEAVKAAGLKTGLITNNVRSGAGTGPGMADDPAKAARIDAIMTRFDHVIESSKAGVRKPDPKIYEMMCEALSVPPAECVFADDLGINLKPARAMGMSTIKVVDEAVFLKELGDALGLDFVPKGFAG